MIHDVGQDHGDAGPVAQTELAGITIVSWRFWHSSKTTELLASCIYQETCACFIHPLPFHFDFLDMRRWCSFSREEGGKGRSFHVIEIRPLNCKFRCFRGAWRHMLTTEDIPLPISRTLTPLPALVRKSAIIKTGALVFPTAREMNTSHRILTTLRISSTTTTDLNYKWRMGRVQTHPKPSTNIRPRRITTTIPGA